MLCKRCELTSGGTVSQPYRCQNPQCSYLATGLHHALCDICSIEHGKCESCGKDLVPGKPRRLAELVDADPHGEAVRSIIESYFYDLSTTCRRVDFERRRVVVTYARRIERRLPRLAFGRAVVYAYAEEPEMNEQRFDVVFAFYPTTTSAARQSVLKRALRWRGVRDIERLFPSDKNDYAARFFVARMDDLKTALRVFNKLFFKANNAVAVEHAHIQPRP